MSWPSLLQRRRARLQFGPGPREARPAWTARLAEGRAARVGEGGGVGRAGGPPAGPAVRAQVGRERRRPARRPGPGPCNFEPRLGFVTRQSPRRHMLSDGRKQNGQPQRRSRVRGDRRDRLLVSYLAMARYASCQQVERLWADGAARGTVLRRLERLSDPRRRTGGGPLLRRLAYRRTDGRLVPVWSLAPRGSELARELLPEAPPIVSGTSVTASSSTRSS